ncbi:MAG: amidase [Opitutus sp.]|nr:amidase [Opitutus sp.]
MNPDQYPLTWFSSGPCLSVKSVVKKILQLVLISGASVGVIRAADFPFAEATIDDLQARMAAGTLTSHELTAAYLARIAEIDRAGPKLNAIIELNPDALAIAEKLDAERKAGRVRGPLHGIPVLIKDNIATADQMETTAGSLALVGLKPPRDAHLVTRLRAAGAVLLGKTNLSEWANFRGERSVSGWSGRGGQTHNPYVLDRNPSGSSSGSAAAVSANLCVVAIGTETNGSIISPSTVCGVVGFKPTVGLVSRRGVIPIAATFDTAGPITRTVRDAALVLAALAGVDERDPITQNLPADLAAKLGLPLSAGALQGARVGVIRNTGAGRGPTNVMPAALDVLRAAGAEVIDVGELPGPAGASSARIDVMLYEMKAGVDAYLAELGPAASMKTMADVIKFNDEHWAQEQPLFGQQYFKQAQAKGPLTEPAYLEAREKCWRVSRLEGIDALMEKHRLDALVGGGAGVAAMAGYPSVIVPFGPLAPLPTGFLFYGRAWSDAKLLALAADFEAKTHARREPKFLPTVEVK